MWWAPMPDILVGGRHVSQMEIALLSQNDMVTLPMTVPSLSYTDSILDWI